MTAYLLRAPAGNAGQVNRELNSTIESAIFATTNPPTVIGGPVKMVAGELQAIEAGDTASDFFGVLTRSTPTISGDTGQALGGYVPNPDTVSGVLVDGYILVVCAQGTPVRNGQVYMRIAVDTGKEIGDFETTLIGGETVLLPDVTFSLNGKDASNVTEIRIQK